MSDHIFRRNLLALSGSSPMAASRLDAAKIDQRLRIRESRSGKAVPVIQEGHREAALHSLMDPVREAERLASANSPGGFVVALGLGAGYGLWPHRASSAVSGIVIVDFEAPLIRAILEEMDLSELFLDGRVSFILDPEEGELEAALLAAYVPPLTGDLRVLPLRGRTDLDAERFAKAADSVRAVLDRISDDYSVQAFFGKLWYKNAVRNLFAAERPAPALPPVRRAIVTAAGPSLEEALPRIRKEQADGAFLIATDTSLPALLGAGLRPGAVVSIDCQTISYYHFLKGIPSGVPLVLDLASPNRLARMTESVRFFSSGHPFCAYLSSRFRRFPALDTSGGNVTHAALSLAEALGADSAFLVGADFSYPEGKSYARGTYIYDYFYQLSGRLSTTEGLFAGFVFRNASVAREYDTSTEGDEYLRYVTKPLMAYREHLERFAAASGLCVKPLRGRGVEIRIPKIRSARKRERCIFAAGPTSEKAEDFLKRYAKALKALPQPVDPAVSYLRGLKPEDRDLWTTLLPAASAFQRSMGPAAGRPAALLETTRTWSIEAVEEAVAER